jgi:hypothetical protein
MVYLQQSANATTFIIYVITAARQSNVVWHGDTKYR